MFVAPGSGVCSTSSGVCSTDSVCGRSGSSGASSNNSGGVVSSTAVSSYNDINSSYSSGSYCSSCDGVAVIMAAVVVFVVVVPEVLTAVQFSRKSLTISQQEIKVNILPPHIAATSTGTELSKKLHASMFVHEICQSE